MDAPAYQDLTLESARALGVEEADQGLLNELAHRIATLATEHSIFRTWCDRADKLYYSTTFTPWGADLWADDPSATTPGRSHVSVNTPAVYVDIPANLQAEPPIENMLATEDSKEARIAAQNLERVYKAWKAEDRIELKFHKATTIKALYGRTAGFVYYDRDEKRPCMDVIQNPRNLYLGYKSDDYEAVEWAANVTLVDPNVLVEKYSVSIGTRIDAQSGQLYPWISGPNQPDQPRPELNFGPARIEVWDYWCRRPAAKRGAWGKPTKMETWNIVVAGNQVISEYRYPEYEGSIPYVPLYNTFIPGAPTGRAELHDMEQLIREKMTRITAGAQVIAKATAGDYWQMVGADAPSSKSGLTPKVNEVIFPGAGNRIEAIQPFVVQFQLEQFLGRLDREMATVSGLNDLLLGLAPAQVLSSSKAINALISNYESRLAMRRILLYTWRIDCWELAVKVWANKDKRIKAIITAGGGTLDIEDPSLSPRDEMETATRALNLVNGKLWSQARGMDAVGVDDPEQEQNIIRGERTDATLFPADVQVMAQLLGALQSLGLNAPPSVQGQAQQQLSRGQNDLRTALGGATPTNPGGATAGGDTGVTPPDALSQGATAPAAGAFAAPQGGPQLQSLIQNGQAKGRILTSQTLGRR